MKLDGKVAIVTGGTRGIGAAVCVRLAKEGCDVAFTGRDEKAADIVIAEINRYKKRGLFFPGDVADKTRMEEIVGDAVEKLGSIDLLVNNAGITRDGLFVRMKEDDWKSVIDTNLTGAYNVTQTVSRLMLKRKTGSIVNISSVIGMTGNAGQANYAASKAGLIGMTKSLAKEFASRQVRVNAIAPGFIETEMTKKLSEDIRERTRQLIPLGYFADPEDIAASVVFLASSDARYITGQVLVVDGGMHM
jgi:3-oxoacyl-[acyl-carrier protein] reductase